MFLDLVCQIVRLCVHRETEAEKSNNRWIRIIGYRVKVESLNEFWTMSNGSSSYHLSLDEIASRASKRHSSPVFQPVSSVCRSVFHRETFMHPSSYQFSEHVTGYLLYLTPRV